MRTRSTGTKVYGPYFKGQQWRVHFVTNSGGKRTTAYEAFDTRTEAEDCIAGARDEAQGFTLRMAVDLFLEKKRSHGLASTTIENYEHRLWRLLDIEKNGSRPLRYVNNRGGELYEASAYGAGDTHINGLNVGRMWGAFCVAKKMLRVNPFKDVEAIGRKRKGSTKERLSVNESRILEAYCFKHADNADCVLTYGYLMLGKRASELVGLDTRDLDDDGWLVRIRKAKSDASVGGVTVPEGLRTMLLQLAEGKAPDAPLFVNLEGRRMTRYVARERVLAVCKAAKVTELPPQALRRTFTDNAGRQGFALRTIAEMTGHTSPTVTKRSYISAETVSSAQVERNLKVLAGGLR